jgi:hypothetical protein
MQPSRESRIQGNGKPNQREEIIGLVLVANCTRCRLATSHAFIIGHWPNKTQLSMFLTCPEKTRRKWRWSGARVLSSLVLRHRWNLPMGEDNFSNPRKPPPVIPNVTSDSNFRFGCLPSHKLLNSEVSLRATPSMMLLDWLVLSSSR